MCTNRDGRGGFAGRPVIQEIHIAAGPTYNTRMKELMPYEIARYKIAGVVNPIGAAG